MGASCSQLSGSLQGMPAASLSSWLGTWEHALLNLCPESLAPTLRPHPQYLHSHLASLDASRPGRANTGQRPDLRAPTGGQGPVWGQEGRAPRHRGPQCAGRGQADRSGERRLRKGAVCLSWVLGRHRLPPPCPDHGPPSPRHAGSGRTDSQGPRKACLFRGRACAMACRADSNVGRWVRIWAEGKADRGFSQEAPGRGQALEPGILPGGCPAGTRGLSRGALLRGTGPPSSDCPPQDGTGQLPQPLP